MVFNLIVIIFVIESHKYWHHEYNRYNREKQPARRANGEREPKRLVLSIDEERY